MRPGTRLALGLAALVLLAALTGGALEPRILNGKVEARGLAAGLEREFRALVGEQNAPAWISYAVPVVAGSGRLCCGEVRRGVACRGRCGLERSWNGIVRTKGCSAYLEGPRRLLVLFRAAQGRVEKIRIFSEDCELDAGGRKVFWLGDAQPEESIELLRGFAASEGGEFAGQAVAAIALHADAAADQVLESFVAPSQPPELREKAVFWLGQARGRRGYQVLKRLLERDGSSELKEEVVFALHVSPVPEAVDTLVAAARAHPSEEVRSKALFWLAQKAGKRAAAAITDAVANDPDTKVKKQAVFALSQLPAEEGVPLLIQVARTNRNPAVRKKAIFWLGQSDDPRALAFFEEVLLH